MKMSKIFKTCIVLAFGLSVSSALADPCSEQGGHSGNGKTTQGQNNSSVTGNIGSTGYHYEIWYQNGNNSMTYYDDGTFKASWNGTNDFLARVGFKYNEDKTHSQIGQLDAEFKFTKQGSAGGYSYIGIYGWTVNPLVEYYIVDDWFNKPGAYLGQKKGEITIDGDTYDIYQNTRNQQPSIKGTSTFPQYFSVRRNARQCGHIDLTAHFKKWESLGMQMGKMYEAKFLVEAGGGSGSFDMNYFKMTVGGSGDSPKSSSSVGGFTPKSSAASSQTSTGKKDACKDEMSKPRGSSHNVNGNQTGSISGTPWGFEQWSAGGSNSMKYYDNGTFEANWNNNQDYLARVGYRYGDNGPGVDHKTKHFTVDYKYEKTGSAQYGYIGVYGWTVNPQVEYYVVDDWYSKPSDQYIGEKFGELEVDGAKYTVHAYVRQQEASKTGTSTFLQIFSVRETPRQCGHIDISTHFKKWDELFTGQKKQLRGSKGGQEMELKFGKVTEVMLMTEAGGGATGSVNYTYFDMQEDAKDEVPASSAAEQPKSSSSQDALPVALKLANAEGNFQVFDMQGRFMGDIKLTQGARVSEVLMARFNKAGVYLLRNGSFMQSVTVK